MGEQAFCVAEKPGDEDCGSRTTRSMQRAQMHCCAKYGIYVSQTRHLTFANLLLLPQDLDQLLFCVKPS